MQWSTLVLSAFINSRFFLYYLLVLVLINLTTALYLQSYALQYYFLIIVLGYVLLLIFTLPHMPRHTTSDSMIYKSGFCEVQSLFTRTSFFIGTFGIWFIQTSQVGGLTVPLFIIFRHILSLLVTFVIIIRLLTTFLMSIPIDNYDSDVSTEVANATPTRGKPTHSLRFAGGIGSIFQSQPRRRNSTLATKHRGSHKIKPAAESSSISALEM